MKTLTWSSLIICVLALTIGITKVVIAATAVNLGTADDFAVLGASTVTNTGSSVINGDLGLSPGASATGFPPGVVNGSIHVADAVAAQAQADLASAYSGAIIQACDFDLTSQDLGGMTLTPGVYCFDTSAILTGTLQLDGQNDPNAVFIFKMGSTLTTASSSIINLLNDAQACNVFWLVGSSATLGTSTTFRGNILASDSATLTTSATVDGRVLAQTGAVTLDTNVVTLAVCQAQATPTPTPTSTSTPTPTPTNTPVPTNTPNPTATPDPFTTAIPSVTIVPLVARILDDTGDSIYYFLTGLALIFTASVILSINRNSKLEIRNS